MNEFIVILRNSHSSAMVISWEALLGWGIDYNRGDILCDTRRGGRYVSDTCML